MNCFTKKLGGAKRRAKAPSRSSGFDSSVLAKGLKQAGISLNTAGHAGINAWKTTSTRWW
ncbi:MAG: hypothetical protein HC849_14190 [Oscillatoriales cyanobacterium RU_3_3]|nr:hypothetical protein [Microcoleus sp. SM1_3_4]NJM61099.1 hypothetical protein [Oscillatoriales cyanobacterium RU_3_3]